ncbi:MAG: recombination protein RecR [Bacteroidetes bacterium GWF2_41_61]|nr:MAG: recombination protein RecR [Bacteroidetes bacterium GWE2_40_15]OFY29467.1 MAG: recombination protein RecR [Bacteroidetes bacterium GWF2_41_61]OFY88784.1 MAG: recombination protein RecR [Bacteroidetes bacterium RIFOXYA12_FULL_40_10]HBG23801.1 recombination protein RecR [Rikenellaceae bacterium]HBZ25951.1 recombination protein RecR [Rikenellaceae bacterium]
MFRNNLSSSLLSNAVEELTALPGIGRKSALRFALHLLNQPRENVERFSKAIIRMREEIKYCSICNMISDTPICSVCSDNRRDSTLVCVVESIRDVLSIENTGEFKGVYHVLGGIISPMDGVSPSDLSIDSLVNRVESGSVEEVFLALSTTMEGETTSYYIYKKIGRFPIKVSTIARGVGFGDELEFTDEVTLGRSITNRQPFIPVNQ